LIECLVCRKICKSRRGLSRHLHDIHKLTNKEYYDKYLKIDKNDGFCKICGKVVNFIENRWYYPKYCTDAKCWNNDIIVKNKKIQTCLNKYGVINPSQSGEIKERKKETLLKHFGVKSPLQSEEIKQKFKNTSNERYNTDYPIQNKKVFEKFRKSMINKYGVDSPIKINKVKQKIRNTCLNKYGVDNPSKLKIFQDKIILTNFQKYGCSHFNKCEIGRNQRRICAIQNIEEQKLNNEPLMPNIGKKERHFLNELQKHCKYKILRQDPSFRYIIGRFPDGYVKELKLFILFDEPFHFDDIECTVLNESSLQESKDYESIKDHKLLRFSEKEWMNDSHKIIERFKGFI
jgi:hypothetical protein